MNVEYGGLIPPTLKLRRVKGSIPPSLKLRRVKGTAVRRLNGTVHGKRNDTRSEDT
jgi:hypothetical protein